jgi:hypothetical protein
MAWMVSAVAWVMGAWREVRIVPALDGVGTSCPAMSAAGLSRHARRDSLGGHQIVSGVAGPHSVPVQGACLGALAGGTGRPAASGEGADDGGCRMFLRVRLLLRRSRGRVPWVRGGRDPDGRAGVRRHRARPAGAAQPCSERARARRAAGDLAGMGGADPGSPSRHRDERQHVAGRDRPGERTLAGARIQPRCQLCSVGGQPTVACRNCSGQAVPACGGWERGYRHWWRLAAVRQS